jgi:hypothetical protein
MLASEAQIKGLKRQPNKKEASKINDKTVPKYKNNPEKPAWFNTEPKEGELHKPCDWNGKPWHWCLAKTGGKCSGNYCGHKPSDCKGQAFLKDKADKRKPEDKKDDTTVKKKVKLAKALQATNNQQACWERSRATAATTTATNSENE